jgi:TPR repeat protein
MMKLLSVLLAVLICFNAYAAETYGDGIKAFKKGNYTEAIKIFSPLANAGLAIAQYNIGFMYANGHGVVQDDAEAFKLYRLAAEQGLAQAQYNIGIMYDIGRGVVQDDAEAFKWYRLAAEQGLAEAQTNIGFMYADGLGVVKNYISAYMWLNLAATNGYDEAINGRDLVAKKLTPRQLTTAQKRASRCQANNYKNC